MSKIGRPPLSKEDRRHQVAFRISPDLERAIDEHAALNGRSKAKEMEFRLAQSFEFDRLRAVVREELTAVLLYEQAGRVMSDYLARHGFDSKPT